jgi:guanyl-specific ribonuclease Sa
MKAITTTRMAHFFRMILFAAVIGLAITACSKTETDKKVTGTVTANEAGEIKFMYSRSQTGLPEYCTFTTDLPAPHNQFVLTIMSGDPTAKRDIDGLTPGQKVTWTATVTEGRPANVGSNNFVHINNN